MSVILFLRKCLRVVTINMVCDDVVSYSVDIFSGDGSNRAAMASSTSSVGYGYLADGRCQVIIRKANPDCVP